MPVFAGLLHEPNLAGWRDALLDEGLTPATVKAYLSSVRSAYQRVLRDNEARQWILAHIPGTRPDGVQRIEADIQAILNEVLARLQNTVHPSSAPVDVVIKQDVADSEHLRLSRAQAEALLGAPDVSTIQGLRGCSVDRLAALHRHPRG